MSSSIIFIRENNNKRNIKEEQQEIEEFLYIQSNNDESILENGESIETNTNTEINEEKIIIQKQDNTNYIAVLEIPKIGLKKGLVDKNSKNNNVDKNVFTLKESTFPSDGVLSHVILAAHSGNSYISFFKNIYKLNIGDKLYLYYNNAKYEYEITKKYEIEKTGKLAISQNNESDITLITCKSGTNKQIILIGNLQN